LPQLPWKFKKWGILKKFWFLSSNFMKHRRNIHRSMWKLMAWWSNSKWPYHGNRGTKIMGWGDVRHCFAMAILVITSSWLLSGDVLLFYVSFSLLLLFFHTFLSARFLGDALIIVGIFTVVCGSFWHVDQIQNGITMETEVPK
jgi:uncharacterized membrane protein (DUF485 family)